MKKTALALAMVAALGVVGCSSTKQQALDQPADNKVALKDTVVSTDFKDQGIKVFYTFTGKLERIEVYGMAPAWKGNVDIVAEADAMDKLVKFVHGQTVSTDRRTRIIARSIDRAKDNTLNRFQGEETVNFTAEAIEQDLARPKNDSPDNTSRRVADRVETTLVNTVTSITSKGRLTGVRKIRDGRQQDGRWYVAVYQWSEKEQATSEFIRNRMR